MAAYANIIWSRGEVGGMKEHGFREEYCELELGVKQIKSKIKNHFFCDFHGFPSESEDSELSEVILDLELPEVTLTITSTHLTPFYLTSGASVQRLGLQACCWL